MPEHFKTYMLNNTGISEDQYNELEHLTHALKIKKGTVLLKQIRYATGLSSSAKDCCVRIRQMKWERIILSSLPTKIGGLQTGAAFTLRNRPICILMPLKILKSFTSKKSFLKKRKNFPKTLLPSTILPCKKISAKCRKG